MKGWLSATWAANWRSFQYFNVYRLILAVMLILAVLFPHEWNLRFNLLPTLPLRLMCGAYMVLTGLGLLLSVYWRRHFNLQLSLQVMLDTFLFSSLMLLAGGVTSGLGGLLLVTLAAASLVGQGRLVLFYAAVATLSVLLTQVYGILVFGFDKGSVVPAGLISAAFFATAILARLLGQRVMVNEELARRRGEELDNWLKVSQRIVERMPGGVLILDRQGMVSQSNPVARSMLGLSGMPGESLALVAPNLSVAVMEWSAGLGLDTLQFDGVRGAELNARFESTSSSSDEVLVFLEDLGRVKEQAQQLKLASLGRLTASIAHEICNPLAAISHAGELLREERRADIQDRLLRILHDNVGRLDRIVREVLELGRQDRVRPERLQLREICQMFIEHLLATEGLPEGLIQLEGGEGTTICFDRAHWHQIMWNLAGNAIRYASRQPGAVRIRIVVLDAHRVEVHIVDDGPGVPEKVRDQIFEPFFTTAHSGTGLGLFIARELCSANGAELELAAQGDGEGAHFIITGRNDCLQAETTGEAVTK